MIKMGTDFLAWLSINFLGSSDPNLHWGRPQTLLFTEGPAAHKVLPPYRGFV